MKSTGIILIAAIIILFALWIWKTKRKKGVAPVEEADVQFFDILVKGVYSPNVLKAKFGKKIKINFKREEAVDCSRFVNFSDWHIRKELPENETVTVEIPADKKGVFTFTCDMSMYQGKLIIE